MFPEILPFHFDFWSITATYTLQFKAERKASVKSSSCS